MAGLTEKYIWFSDAQFANGTFDDTVASGDTVELTSGARFLKGDADVEDQGIQPDSSLSTIWGFLKENSTNGLGYIEALVKLDGDTGSRQAIVGNTNINNSVVGLFFGFVPDGNGNVDLRALMSDGSVYMTGGWFFIKTSYPVDSSWHRVKLEVDSSRVMRGYIDGVEQNSMTLSGGTSSNWTDDFWLMASRQKVYPLNGGLAWFKVQDYQKGEMVTYYAMEDDSDFSIYDWGTNNINATAENLSWKVSSGSGLCKFNGSWKTGSVGYDMNDVVESSLVEIAESVPAETKLEHYIYTVNQDRGISTGWVLVQDGDSIPGVEPGDLIQDLYVEWETKFWSYAQTGSPKLGAAAHMITGQYSFEQFNWINHNTVKQEPNASMDVAYGYIPNTNIVGHDLSAYLFPGMHYTYSPSIDWYGPDMSVDMYMSRLMIADVDTTHNHVVNLEDAVVLSEQTSVENFVTANTDALQNYSVSTTTSIGMEATLFEGSYWSIYMDTDTFPQINADMYIGQTLDISADILNPTVYLEDLAQLTEYVQTDFSFVQYKNQSVTYTLTSDIFSVVAGSWDKDAPSISEWSLQGAQTADWTHKPPTKEAWTHANASAADWTWHEPNKNSWNKE